MDSPPRRWRAPLLLAVVLGAASHLPSVLAQSRPDTLVVSRADAVADLDALFAAIERIHPNPYLFRPHEMVTADRQQLTGTLPDTMTRADWWRRFAPLVAGLADGHTEAPPPIAFLDQVARLFAEAKTQDTRRDVFEQIRQFPSGSVIVDRDGHLIVTSATLAEGVTRGDRIASINGEDADGLVAEWIRATSCDNDANRAAQVVLRLTDLLAVHSMVPPYRLTIAGAAGGERTVTIEGQTMRSAIDARNGAPANFSYRVVDRGVGYMDFYSMDGDFGRFKKALATMFRQAAADTVTTLIVDVRNNMGGYSQFGEELLRYLTRTPYRTWSRQEIKRSEELRKQFAIAPPLRWAPLKYLFTDTRQIYAGPTGTLGVWTKDTLTTPRTADLFFSGSVCVLTGPRTFSAAVSLADAVKTYRLATLVGEETGGRANSTMEPVPYTLPRSGFAVSIASGRTVRANGDANDDNGIIPDIVVPITRADIRDGRDPVLDRARDCPPVQAQGPRAKGGLGP